MKAVWDTWNAMEPSDFQGPASRQCREATRESKRGQVHSADIDNQLLGPHADARFRRLLRDTGKMWSEVYEEPVNSDGTLLTDMWLDDSSNSEL